MLRSFHSLPLDGVFSLFLDEPDSFQDICDVVDPSFLSDGQALCSLKKRAQKPVHVSATDTAGRTRTPSVNITVGLVIRFSGSGRQKQEGEGG